MSDKIESLNKIKAYLDNSYLNVQGISSTPFDQAYMIKMLTKIVVGATTVFWTFIELKDYLKLIRGEK